MSGKDTVVYDYGLIGNCRVSVLIGANGSMDWLCLPRPDSPPVFGRLLDPNGGHFSIVASGTVENSRQSYLPNTNVLVTEIELTDGSAFRITDFCPRFQEHGSIFRPNAVFRTVEPIRGAAEIRVSFRPVSGWDKEPVKPVIETSKLRFDIRGEPLRLSTTMPITYLTEETPFRLKEPLHFGLSCGIMIEENLATLIASYLKQTIHYWNVWVKHCTIPSLYQRETIRSALTLKLHCYEDTGAILAALTTSLPEENGNGRNWDYRFCWLRDAYFVLSAFRNLGHFEEMEGFIKFLLAIAEKSEKPHHRLRPVYRLDQSLPLPEEEHPNWNGFQGSAPVRSGNQAAEHVQNDVYGEMVLTLAPIFFDERFHHLRTPQHEELLKYLANACAQNIPEPDAGLWELRNGWQRHSFSSLMSWAGLERIRRIREKGFLRGLELDLDDAIRKAETAIAAASKEGSLRNGPLDESWDAALLQLPILRYPDEELCKETVSKIAEELRYSNGHAFPAFLYRYLRKDDFGHPRSAFLVCSFWLVQALAKTGQLEVAREFFAEAMKAANSLGLFSEHFVPSDRTQLGNFPQAYSHVGQINAAFVVSSPWDKIL